MSNTNATAEQLAALTVPATLPGVVRRFTPLRRDIRLREVEINEVAWDVDGERGRVYPIEPGGMNRWLGLGGFDVPLWDATGRAHVAWAVAKRVGVTPFASPLELVDDTEYTDECPREHRISIGPDCDVFGVNHLVWEGLAELDPFDDTRLPDGSRLVDAEALRLVALHVLGGGQ